MTVYDLMQFARGPITICYEEWGIVCPDGQEDSCDGCQYALDDKNCGGQHGVVVTKRFEGNAADVPIRLAYLPVDYIKADKGSIRVVLELKHGNV